MKTSSFHALTSEIGRMEDATLLNVVSVNTNYRTDTFTRKGSRHT